jgi:hypothetical protein
MIFSCRPVDYTTPIFYSDYFPIELSNVKEYYITNISHTSFGKDTTFYFLKEIISEDFIDQQGDLAFRVERFWKFDSISEYLIKDVWSTKKTQRSAELVEENERFVKLIFPLNNFTYWNGNALNSRDYQEYIIEDIHDVYTKNNFSFDSCVTVVQNYKSNQIEYESDKEIYAKGIGLVYRENIILNINNGNILSVNYGSEYFQELITY